MALGEPLPKQVFGHPWLLQGGEKMSKSKGNVIYADDMIDLFGVDAVRYFCLHEMPYENDGVITWELMVERYNSDLANTLGNLVQRALSMSNKYFDGVMADKGAAEPVDDDLKAVVTGARDICIEKMDTLHAADALTEIFKIFKRLNKYIDETEPWVLAKDEAKSDRLSTVLYNLADGISTGASLLYPFLPDTAENIAKQFNTELRDFDDCDKTGLYPSGTKVIDKPEMLFARKDVNEVLKQTEEITKKQKEEFKKQQAIAYENLKKAGKLNASSLKGDKKTGAVEEDSDEAVIDVEKKPQITYDDFSKLQFRVGKILKCEEVPKSKKLLCSQVQAGSETLQIVSGIKKYYSAEEMVGKKVMVLTNLAPAKLAGVESQGMLLCAEDADGKLALIAPEKDMPSGAEIS